jgi:hypothetical protein
VIQCRVFTQKLALNYKLIMKLSLVSLPADQQITTSLTSLCKQWRENRGDHLPGICKHLMTNVDGHLPITIIPGKSYFSPIQHQSDSLATERNLSIAGVLAGLLFILLIIAAVLRIRARNNKKVRMRNHPRGGNGFLAQVPCITMYLFAGA